RDTAAGRRAVPPRHRRRVSRRDRHPRLVGRTGNPLLAMAGCAAMLIGTAWISRLSASTGYLTGLLAPMVIFGVGQGLGLSTLTTAGMAGVEARDAGVAGGLVNVTHHTGGALGL